MVVRSSTRPSLLKPVTLDAMDRQPDMRQLMKQAQQMQEQLAQAQADLAERRFEGSAGGGMVKAVVTGSPELVEIEISPQVVDPDDIEMLQDLVVAAVRQAMEEATKATNEQLGGLTGGLGGLLG
jgi:DNA-binding YbaB/EbfC family protein